ncbi:MAG: hypothetical protein IJK18_04835 [Clostridia bacterium]|nr:hypothetical protein [Clostridia bacterium]
MENASKALLIAAGILLVMLIIGLIIFSWSKFSDFYKSNDELEEIENTARFNLQFENYKDRKVYGYELISLANKVADYNFKHSDHQDAKNDEKYKPIEMTVDFKGKSNVFNFGEITSEGKRIKENKQNSIFYNNNIIKQSSTRNDITKIISNVTGIEDFYGDKDIATKLAKSINTLILSDEQIQYNLTNKKMTEEESKASAVANYKYITKNNQNITYKQMVDNLTGNNGNILKYYEYYQFKTGIFKCTNTVIDDVTERVVKIDFEFTGELE